MDHADERALLNRRMLMAGGLAAAGAATLLPGLAAARAAAPVLPADEKGRAAVVRRMRFRTDAGVYMWWFRGRTYAQQGAKLIPVCGLVFGSMIKLTPRGDGGFDTVQYELGFRTDFDTGAHIEKLRNPVTGEMIDLPIYPVGPTHLHYSADNVPEVPETIGGSRFSYDHRPELFWQAGDTVFMQYQSQSRVETQGASDRIINDFGMIYGPAKSALDPGVMSAPAWVQGTDVTDYARWLKMPANSGTQTLRSIGAKVHRFEDMPADWLEIVSRIDPKMHADPMSVFDRSEATYKG